MIVYVLVLVCVGGVGVGCYKLIMWGNGGCLCDLGGGGGVKWLCEVMKVICVGVSQRICAGCELFCLLGREFESVQFFLLIF